MVGLARFALLGAAAAAITASGAAAAELRPAAAECGPNITADSPAVHCVTDDGAVRLGVRASRDIAVGTVETFATLTDQAGNAFAPDRLVTSDVRRLGDAHRVMIAGVTAKLLDERLTVSTQIGVSDYLDRSTGRADLNQGAARMVRLDFKLAERPGLTWSVAAEMSSVSDDFFIGQGLVDGARLALPGKRVALSSSLAWRQMRFSAAIDDYRGSFGDFAAGRFAVNRKGLSLSLRSTRGRYGGGEGDAFYSGQTDSRSATLELDLATMMPALVMDETLPAALIPKYAMIGVRQGSSETSFAGVTEHFERGGIELNATWETPLGETSLGYWRERQVGAEAALGQREERMIQLSHMVRRGDWRFGVDAMVSTNRSTRGSGLADRNVAFGGSIAYDTPGGPRLMVQLSQDRGRMESDDLSYLTTRRGAQASATLDLTDWLRQRFERSDLKLRIDYRRQLDRSTTVSAYEALVDRWNDGFSGEGLLVAFGMKL